MRESLLIRNELVPTDTERSFRLDGLSEGLTLQMAAASDEALSDAMSGGVRIMLNFPKDRDLLHRLWFYKKPCDRKLGFAVRSQGREGDSFRYVENAVDLNAPLRIEYRFTGKHEGAYRYSLKINEKEVELSLLAKPRDLHLDTNIPLKIEYLGARNEQMDEEI